MEINLHEKEKFRKEDTLIITIIKFFNNLIEKILKTTNTIIRHNEIRYLNFFLELNVKLMSTNKLRCIVINDHSKFVESADKELKDLLFKFLIFIIFLLNMQDRKINKNFSFNKDENLKSYILLFKKLYFENYFDDEKLIAFFKYICSLALFKFDANIISNTFNSKYSNVLYKRNMSMKKFSNNNIKNNNNDFQSSSNKIVYLF